MKRLLLVGGGHAHLEVLREAARRPFVGTEIVLLSPYPAHYYSSMVPGLLQRRYREAELSFDLPALCAAARASFVEDWAEAVDGPGRCARTAAGALDFDAASLDVGSDPAALDLPGVRQHAYTVRPMTRAAALAAALEALAAQRPERAVSVCVVGGGAAGAEVAWAVHRRLTAAGHVPRVTLLERAPELLAEYGPAARRRAGALLHAREIRVLVDRDVAAVTPEAVTLTGGERVDSELTLWLTGAAPNAFTRRSTLAHDARGFVLVDPTLRETGGAPVWGAGDCVTPKAHPHTPKAGVYAVRQAPVLAANLRAFCEGRAPSRRFTPQPHFLALLNTGDGRALLRWHGVLSHSRLAWELKDWIDRRYVRRYTVGQGMTGDG